MKIISIILVVILFLATLAKASFCLIGDCENFVWPTKVEIAPSDDLIVTLTFSEGTTMFSIPITLSKNDKVLFEDGDIYTWNEHSERYHIAQRISSDRVYWRLSTHKATLIVRGKAIRQYSKILKEGWHLISGCSTKAEITSPDGTIVVIYTIMPIGYVRVRSSCISPGQGYWILFNPDSKYGTVFVTGQ